MKTQLLFYAEGVPHSQYEGWVPLQGSRKWLLSMSDRLLCFFANASLVPCKAVIAEYSKWLFRLV
jgi:hypothetical protein